MPFLNELKDGFYNKNNPLIEKLRQEIRQITFNSGKMTMSLKNPHYRFLLDMDDASISRFFAAVFETDDVQKKRVHLSSTSSVSWFSYCDEDSSIVREIIVNWRL